MDLDRVVEICKNMAVDNAFKLERARSPASKRQTKENLSFWATAGYYLEIVGAMSDDEFLDMENRVKSKKGGSGE